MVQDAISDIPFIELEVIKTVSCPMNSKLQRVEQCLECEYKRGKIISYDPRIDNNEIKGIKCSYYAD